MGNTSKSARKQENKDPVKHIDTNGQYGISMGNQPNSVVAYVAINQGKTAKGIRLQVKHCCNM